MRWLYIGCFICLFHFVAYAQKENNQWVISWYGPIAYHSLVDFNFFLPDTSTLISPARFFLTIASICDSSGQLLFYSNGHTVYNRQHDTLWNGAGLNPGYCTNYYAPNAGMGIPQGALIIPRPGFADQYILFYVSCEPVLIGGNQIFGQALSLPYSIIDMSLDGGLGGILPGKKDVIAYYDTLIYGRLTAVKHGNGRDWWVIAHKSNTNIYNKLLVTPDTMILYQQQIGRPHVFEQVVQQAVFSTQGDKYVIGITIDASYIDSVWTYPTNIIDLYDFDRCTGQLSNVRFIEVPNIIYVATGCGFSPDGRWLYVNTNKDIYQYDTWSSNINATRTVVATWDTTTVPKTLYCFQLLGPDGKIYLTNYHSAALLHVIDNPDAQGAACNVIKNGLQLPVLNTFVLPNAVNYSLGPVAGSICDTLLSVTISEIERSAISVYPNPATTQLTLQYSPPKTTSRAAIYNSLGEEVQRLTLPPGTTRQQLNIAHLPSGLYLIKVEADGKSGVKRFVKSDSR